MAKKVIPEVVEALTGEEVDFTEEQAKANAAIPPVKAEPPPAPVVAATQPITLTFEQLQALLALQTHGTEALARALTQGIKESQPQRPSNEIAPGISDQNPLGEKDHPMPGLRCAVSFGIRNPKTQQIQRTYPFEAEDLTVYEQLALNTLEPGEHVIRLYDGQPIKIAIVPERDEISNEIRRLTIVVPQSITQRGSEKKNLLPGACDLVAQVTGRDFRSLSKDDLAWFMAEHKAQRYVTERPKETVAA